MLQRRTQTAGCDVSTAVDDNISTQSVTTTTSTLRWTRADRVVEDNRPTGPTSDLACRDSMLVCLLNSVHPVNTRVFYTHFW